MKETGTESLPHTSSVWCWGLGYGYEKKVHFSLRIMKPRKGHTRVVGTQLPSMVTVANATRNCVFLFLKRSFKFESNLSPLSLNINYNSIEVHLIFNFIKI